MRNGTDQWIPAKGIQAKWIQALQDLGYQAPVILGAGMEGTVVELADGSIVKVWYRRVASELLTLKTFYDAVGAADLPFAVPKVLDVIPLADRCATLEMKLVGQPLWRKPGASPPLDAPHVDAVVSVLTALAGTEPTPNMAILPILQGEAAFGAGTPFGSSLAALVESRVAKNEASLGARLADLDDLVSAVTGHVAHLAPASPALVHGDLVPGNVLVHNERPTALLDFGFMSTIGDPAFDAAIAASIYDMYGPAAAQSEARLDEAIRYQFGYERARLAIYRAAYAFITANCFSPSGSDGHFNWCVHMLRRPEVREVLGV